MAFLGKNAVVHFEIPADNVGRAKGFYSKVFGWKLESWDDKYVMVNTVDVDEKTRMPRTPGAINGGMLARGGPLKNIVITVNVDSIDAACKKIKSSGGEVVREKLPVGDFGYAAYFRDSEGNVVGLWEDVR
ncbi:MAG TPA: VOC family protein [archaeon]|nr:VOC family protein [archaeon]HLD80753.1 VOC family protein [archaeon]